MTNIWQKLTENNRPFFVLAPMEDVTDTVFRQLLIESNAAPDLMFTEFTNVEGVQHITARDKVVHRLKYIEKEKPLIAQIWGITPEDYQKTAEYVLGLGFDGVDINMGCPVKKIIKKGACSALIKNPSLAKEIVEATKEGVAGKIPVSVKTRIGFSSIDTENWCGFLLSECQPDALSVHGRTVSQMSKVPNNWGEIGKVVKLRDSLKLKTPIIGNGDVLSYEQGVQLAERYNLDGIMIGRGVFHNPWIFAPKVDYELTTPADKIKMLKRHVELWQENWEVIKNYHMLKRFYKIYVKDFEGAKELRVGLMETESCAEALAIIDSSSLSQS